MAWKNDFPVIACFPSSSVTDPVGPCTVSVLMEQAGFAVGWSYGYRWISVFVEGELLYRLEKVKYLVPLGEFIVGFFQVSNVGFGRSLFRLEVLLPFFCRGLAVQTHYFKLFDLHGTLNLLRFLYMVLEGSWGTVQ